MTGLPSRMARALLLAGVCVALSAPSAGAMTSIMGGHTLGVGSPKAARAELGWPGLELTWIVPATNSLDVSPQLGIIFGHNLRTGLVGFEPGAELRWHLASGRGFSLAFYADPALLLWIPTDGSPGQLGMRFGGPGLVGGWQVGSWVNLFAALRLPARLMVAPDLALALPILTDAGFELELHRTEDAAVHLTGTFTIGPELCTGACRDSDLTARMVVGATVLW